MTQGSPIDKLIEEAAKAAKLDEERHKAAMDAHSERLRMDTEVRNRFANEVASAIKDEVNATNKKLTASGLPTILMQEDRISPHSLVIVLGMGAGGRALHSKTALSGGDAKTTIFQGQIKQTPNPRELRTFSYPIEGFDPERLLGEHVVEYTKMLS